MSMAVIKIFTIDLSYCTNKKKLVCQKNHRVKISIKS